jgi:hypothetical protein
MADNDTKPYGLAKEFERIVATLCATSYDFLARVGQDVDANAIADPLARWTIKAAQALGREIGFDVGSNVVIVQRLRRWMDEGQLTLETVLDCSDMLCDVMDAGLPAVDVVVNELAPVVRRRVQKQAIEDAMGLFAQRENLDDVAAEMSRASRIGTAKRSMGTWLGKGSVADINALKAGNRLPTGILELDLFTGGGLPVGQICSWLGTTGSGKSQALNGQASMGVMCGLFVAFASLELAKGVHQARQLAALTGIAYDDIVGGGRLHEAISRYEEIASGGMYVVEEFEGLTTPFDEVAEWVKRVEDAASRKVDLLVVDYGDRLNGDTDSLYLGGRNVYQSMVNFAKQRQVWLHTATQATRLKGHAQVLTQHHTAQSMEKPNACDQMFSINPDVSRESVRIHVIKDRTGAGTGKTTPELPVEYAYGRLCSMVYPGHVPAPGGASKVVDTKAPAQTDFDDLYERELH